MQTKPNYLEIKYRAPWTGIYNQAPEILIPASSCPFVENFIFRNGELTSAPRFKELTDPPDNSAPIMGLFSFIDNNNVTHTVALTENGAFQLNYLGNNRWTWNLIANLPFGAGKNQFAIAKFLNQGYWSNGSVGTFTWDGTSSIINEITNPTYDIAKATYGARFIGELGYHLLLLNTTEIDPAIMGGTKQSYPQRIRWSASGNATVWNPAVDPGSGYNDQFDVPDQITGWTAVGKAGYIFRTNGISQMAPTGIAARPFQFDHLWASEQGIGNVIPELIASYGAVGFFGSMEQFYQISANGFEPIGGGARDVIIRDLDIAVRAPTTEVLPGYHRRFIYTTYNINIPHVDGTVMWIYNIEDKNWSRRWFPGKFFTCSKKLVAVA